MPARKPRRTGTFEYSQITPYIFIGTDACCTLRLHDDLVRKGITADISLREKHLDTPFGVTYFLWLPTPDHKAPTQTQLLLGATTIDTLVRSKEKIFVHCRLGHTRSPTLVAAYFILKGMRTTDAIARVRQHRPAIHPTPVQVRALRTFEQRMRARKP